MSIPIELLAASSINSLGGSLGEISKELFVDAPKNPLVPDSELLIDRECYVGVIKEELNPLPKELEVLDSRFSRILQNLYLQIKAPLDGLVEQYGAARIGVVLGSSTSGVDRAEGPFIELEKKGQFPDDYHFFHQELGAGSKVLSELAGLNGPSYTISTACSSSAKVFSSGRNLLSAGLCDAVVVGGVDALCRITTRGFKSLDLISDGISNPMSANRDGLNLGEGGALFLLVKGEEGVQLLGVGESSDAYHVASPDPTGGGAALAMTRALRDAKRSANEVAYLNLHGTGTLNNDSMESKAVESVLGLSVPCSSTKPLTGHLLGAAGAAEAAICYSMLSESEKKIKLPFHSWDGVRDVSLPDIRLAAKGEEILFGSSQIVLSNSFAFGGSNCCLAFGRGK